MLLDDKKWGRYLVVYEVEPWLKRKLTQEGWSTAKIRATHRALAGQTNDIIAKLQNRV